MADMLSLQGKIAVITGGSRGIGAQIARTYAQLGATSIIIYQGSTEKAEALVAEITARGQQAAAFRCDVSDFGSCEQVVKNIIKEYRRIDILVNNAGITADGLLMAMSENDFDRVIATNLKGAFNMTRFAARYMMKQRCGRIINMASASGVMGNAGQANYSASKAGLIGFTKSVARELASRNVLCNAIAPGFIVTDMTAALPEQAKAFSEKLIPLGRFGQPQDIAAAAAFLASDLGSYVTGQVLEIDGGLHM